MRHHKSSIVYDLHINSMTYTLFFIPDYQFQKVFYVSLGNKFFTVVVEAALVVEALGNCPVCPPLNRALAVNCAQ